MPAHSEEGVRGWRPIETAPRDGTPILAYWPGVEGGRAAYGVCWWDVDWRDEDSEFGPPSHWQHLPKPPVQP